MARPRLRGVLLCEDREHERFFGRLLRKWFGHGKLHIEQIPNNRGDASKWVLKNYAREVRLVRSKRGENVALVVVIDGDDVKMRQRLLQLDLQLTDGSLEKRGKDERIAIFIPTRNIETWELWLCGDSQVDEEMDFKRQFQRAQQCDKAITKKAVAAWFQGLSPEQQAAEQETLPSLAAGRVETRRLDRPPT